MPSLHEIHSFVTQPHVLYPSLIIWSAVLILWKSPPNFKDLPSSDHHRRKSEGSKRSSGKHHHDRPGSYVQAEFQFYSDPPEELKDVGTSNLVGREHPGYHVLDSDNNSLAAAEALPPATIFSRPLGRLHFVNAQHTWAFELGRSLALVEVCLSSQEGSDPGFYRRTRDNWRVAREDVATYLRDNDIVWPDGREFLEAERGADGPTFQQLLREFPILLRRVKRDASPVHLAFVLIGSASAYFDFAKQHSTRNKDNERIFLDMARSRIALIKNEAGDYEIVPRRLEVLLRGTFNFSDLEQSLQPRAHVILMANADVQDEDRLRLQAEEKAIKTALHHYKHSYDIRVLPECSFTSLIEAIQEHRPSVLHFSGHGDRGGLSFMGSTGNTEVLDATGLAAILEAGKERGLKGVVLNSCDSAELATTAADIVGSAISMRGPIGDLSAAAWTSVFYSALGKGEDFNQAFSLALTRVMADMTIRNDVQPRLTVLKRAAESS